MVQCLKSVQSANPLMLRVQIVGGGTPVLGFRVPKLGLGIEGDRHTCIGAMLGMMKQCLKDV